MMKPGIVLTRRKIEGHSMTIEFKEEARATRHNGRRVPLQQQEDVETDIEKPLKGIHFENGFN